MAKLDALKEKVAALRQQLAEKLDKIPFLKKFAAKAPESAGAPAPSHSLGAIYRSGGTLTRFQVVCFVVFLIAAVISSAIVGKRIFQRMQASEEKKLKADYSHGLGDIKRRMEENASVLALGKFTVSAYMPDSKNTSATIDLWLRVNNVEAANFVQNHDSVLRDKTMDALNELYVKKVNLLTVEGKEIAKAKIRESLNQAVPKAAVEEIYFHNMVLQ